VLSDLQFIGRLDRYWAHDACHRFVGDGVWSTGQLWRVLAIHAVGAFCPTGVVSLDCDDRLFHKSGRKVAGAGICGPERAACLSLWLHSLTSCWCLHAHPAGRTSDTQALVPAQDRPEPP
jgi:hypothetical protein